MKLIIIFTTLLMSITITQESELSGRYFIDFKDDSFQKDCYINFDKKNFTLKQTNSLTHTGTINYGKTLTSFEYINSDIIIDFRTEDIGKDTINFQVHNKKSGPINYLDISVNSGKFIKNK